MYVVMFSAEELSRLPLALTDSSPLSQHRCLTIHPLSLVRYVFMFLFPLAQPSASERLISASSPPHESSIRYVDSKNGTYVVLHPSIDCGMYTGHKDAQYCHWHS